MNRLARTRTGRIATAVAASGIAVALLAGCGSSTDTADPVTPVAPTAQSDGATSEPPLVGGDPITWAPVEITADMNGSTIELVTGQAAIFVGLPEAKGGYFVTSSNEAAVMGTPAPDATTVPGLQAMAVGEATVTLWDGNPDESENAKPIMEVDVTVKAQDATSETEGTESEMGSMNEDDTTSEM